MSSHPRRTRAGSARAAWVGHTPLQRMSAVADNGRGVGAFTPGSGVEPQALGPNHSSEWESEGKRQSRTGDSQIMSLMLYQLS